MRHWLANWSGRRPRPRLPPTRVECVAQPVADQVEGQHRQEDRRAGEHRQPRRLVEEPLRFEDFRIHLPSGPGLGVTLNHDKLRRYARA